jgi:putative transport protein
MQPLIDTLCNFPSWRFAGDRAGVLVGRDQLFRFRFGIAGVLFAGLAIGALHPGIAAPDMVPTLGLILFVYMIGIQSGPALAEAIRKRGYRDSLFAVGVLAFGPPSRWAWRGS